MHDDVLTPKARELFPLLSKFKEFYLVGGTALALQLGHRVSVDFDLFTEKPLPPSLLQKIKRTFGTYQYLVTYRTSQQINLTIAGVKCTFFSFPYPVIDLFVMYHGVPLTSIREIAAMKALAVGHRLAYKDYVDWYFLLARRAVTLDSVIELAKKKFDGDFSDRLFLGQLASFDDVKTQTIDFLGKKVPRGRIEAAIAKAVKKHMAA